MTIGSRFAFARSVLAVPVGLAIATPAAAHPLDGLSPAEIEAVVEILKDQGRVDENSRFPLIELKEPDKSVVVSWKEGDPEPREAVVDVMTTEGVFRGVVDITGRAVVSWELAAGEPMMLRSETPDAGRIALENPELLAALEKRGLTPDEVWCAGPPAGAYGLPEEQDKRIWKVVCSVKTGGSNVYAKPVEGLSATIDMGEKMVLDVIDTGPVPIAKDSWGYTEEEVAAREDITLRPRTNPANLQQSGGANYTIDGSAIAWDMWRFHYRVNTRVGVVLSQIEANDGGNWRSVLYQAHLSEVFVPYMDPAPVWYWRTFIDSGEYGFGLYMTPLRAGVDCPAYAAYLPAVVHADDGSPLEIADAICVFERNVGDPAWRHFEFRHQTGNQPVPAEGRPATELVVRSASVLGNYDYYIDYVFRQNGFIDIRVGATGLDEVKGVASTSMKDATAADDTSYGTLVVPNLVAPNHDHFFNFRLDFDIDGRENSFMRTALERADMPDDLPRRTMWKTSHEMPETELQGRYKINPSTPAMYHVVNMNEESCLGHHPGYMILPNDSVAYSLLDVVNDVPAKRNAYIEYTLWNTPYDVNEVYAGGEYAIQSDGSDGLAAWVQKDRSIANTDIVTWYTMGFHHVPHMEDWPVMSTTWKSITLMPFNFFCHNPAITIRNQ